jgi:hypothetical protein
MTPEAFEERDNLLDRGEVAAENRFTTWFAPSAMPLNEI